jgi:NAD(P)H-flavin reductase
MAIRVASNVVSTYTSPGQYVEVCIDEQTGFFVLANEPGAPEWELVMRSGGGASEVLLGAQVGAPLEVTSAMGAGFPMANARGKPLIVALGGTGVAAGRPIIGRRIADGDAARTRVFVGVRTRGELALRDCLEGWLRNGVHVLVCLSQDDGPIEGIPYEHGYVQDVLRSLAAGPSLVQHRIFVVGVVSMIEALRSLAPELGVAPEDVETNY